jgi:imidazole glycerol-phosphate synthase subunit HisH
MIGIVDLNCCNIGSVRNMLDYLNIENIIIKDKSFISSCSKLILPGLGSFDYAIKNMHDLNLFDELKIQILNNKKPILGICLGMHILGSTSEEGNLRGLNVLDMVVKKFRKNLENDLIPHMGWNTADIEKDNILFKDMSYNSKFYFVHSYYIPRNKFTVSSTNYISKFSSSINFENIYGVQFHPEKSHKYGMKILENFSTYAK